MAMLELRLRAKHITFLPSAFRTCSQRPSGARDRVRKSSLASKFPEASEHGTWHFSHSLEILAYLYIAVPSLFLLLVTPTKWIILTCPSHIQPLRSKLTSWTEGSFRGSCSQARYPELILNQWFQISRRAHGGHHTWDSLFSEPRHTPAVGRKWISHVKLSLTPQLGSTPLQPDLKEIS